MTAKSISIQLKRFYLVLISLAWTVFFIFLVQDVTHVSLLAATIESLVFNSLLFIAAVAANNVLRYYNPSRDQVFFMIGAALILSALVSFLDEIIIEHLFFKWVDSPMAANYTLMLHGFAFMVNAASISFSYQAERNKEESQLNKKRDEAEKLSKEAELLTLRHQLQPHFLFNSLNSINALVSIDQKQARQMVQQLSSFLRGTISANSQAFVPLKKELEQLRLYLEIEKVRFGHRLNTEMKVAEGIEEMQLPMLVLQPILENAIKFGLYGTTDDVNILIDIQNESGYLVVSISNPFDPDYKTMSGTGFGLSSIKRRLFLLFSRNDLLTTSSRDNTFTATLKIPQNND